MANDDKRDETRESQDDFDNLLDDDEEIDLETLLASDGDAGMDDLLADAATSNAATSNAATSNAGGGERDNNGDVSMDDDLLDSAFEEADGTDEIAAEAGRAAGALSAAAGRKAPKGKGFKKKPKKSRKTVERKKAVAKPLPKIKGGRAYAFVCSECYDEYWLPANYSQETVTCVECLHVGKKPDQNFLRTVAMHKQGEKRALTIVALCGFLLGLCVFGLISLNSSMGIDLSGAKNHDLINYSLMGGSAVLGLLFFWLLARYEGNRWEVYF